MSSWKISTKLEVEYEIKCSPDLFSTDNTDIIQYCNNKTLIVIDEIVSKFYLKTIQKYFSHHNIKHHIVIINGVEENKNLDNLIFALKEFEQFGIQRREPVIAIGGGVTCDIVGLAANLYRRGIPYIRIPTTLLGLVDVSVAAKTGINFENRRNRLGTYYPPIATFLCKNFLKTLPEIEISSGLGEVLKMAVSKDEKLFGLLEHNGADLLNSKLEHECADELIERSIQGMKEELKNNLWEKNLARIVDFGHSFSPIIEMRSLESNNKLTHGQAVTLDVIFSCIISNIRGMMTLKDIQRVIVTAKNMSLPTYHKSFTEPSLLIEALNDTIKHRNGKQNLPIPTSIGDCIFLNDVSNEEIIRATKIFGELNGE
jgi:3-dehydroquinate synthetase